MCSIAIKTYLNHKIYYQLGRKIIMVSFHTEKYTCLIAYVFYCDHVGNKKERPKQSTTGTEFYITGV